MQLNAYLIFNGNCEEAFHFYEKCLGAKILMKARWGDTPAAADAPADWKDKLIHARLELNGTVLMGSDPPPERFKKMAGVSINVSADTPAQAEKVFHALAENGHVHMPLAETFWALRFGMLTDQFGVGWMVNCEREAKG